jgi:RNA polymerase sigma-70 factor (ECF subfamily)
MTGVFIKNERRITPVGTAPDAEQLLQRCQKGDQAALRDLMRLYQERVFQFLLRVSGDSSLAEEATVECFYRVWTKCSQHRDGANVEAWIFRIAHRALLDLARRQQRWWRRLIAGSRTREADAHSGPLERLIEADEEVQRKVAIESALANLKDEDRALIHLYYFEGRALSEISMIMNTSRDALKMRLMRVRQRLAKLLDDENDR